MTSKLNVGDFLGKGFAFPISVNSRGGISWSSGERDIESAIKIILLTSKGERVMRPTFGSNLNDHVFGPNSLDTHGLIAHEIRDALEMWEPRIDLEEVLVEPHPEITGCVLVDIHYIVKATNDQRNLVFPFYTIPSDEQ